MSSLARGGGSIPSLSVFLLEECPNGKEASWKGVGVMRCRGSTPLSSVVSGCHRLGRLLWQHIWRVGRAVMAPVSKTVDLVRARQGFDSLTLRVAFWKRASTMSSLLNIQRI